MDKFPHYLIHFQNAEQFLSRLPAGTKAIVRIEENGKPYEMYYDDFKRMVDAGGGEAPEPVRAPEDNWKHRSAGMLCRTCIFYVPKMVTLGRCRRHAPSYNAGQGWPPVFETDWCGDHKLDENKL